MVVTIREHQACLGPILLSAAEQKENEDAMNRECRNP
jgi:hypothetical protein